MNEQLQAIATIFSLVNPAVCAAIFMRLENGRSGKARIIDATKAILAVMTILMLAAFFGSQILHLFGISLDAFAVAGGAILAWIGFSMLSGGGASSSPEPDAVSAPSSDTAPSLAPFILFAASPGTITGVITISASHTKFDLPITAIIAIVAVLAVTWGILVVSGKAGGSSAGKSVIQDMLTRYMGLIVIAMGIQFALSGLKSFMAG